MDIDFSKATGIAVVDLGTISLVRYSIRATQNGKPLETLEGAIGVKGAGGLGDQFMKGLVLHYTFDNPDKLAADNGPAERHGTVHGAKHSNDGRRNGAADFDGRTSHIRTPVVDTTKDLTWAMWVRPRSLVGTSGVVQLLGSKGHGWVWNSCNTSIHITRADERLLSLRFYVQLSETHAASVGTDVTQGEILDHWVHVASTVSTEGWRIYKDGRLAAHSRETGKFGSPCAMIIGANDNGPQRYFDGLIDEVMVFDRALSSDEVLLLYESQK